jgi:sugar phosphate permease
MHYVIVVLFLLLTPNLAMQKNYIPIYILTFLANGSFWGSFLLSKIHCLECFPTEIRGTSSGWRSFSFAFGITGGSLLSSELVTVMSLSNVYLLFSSFAIVVIPLLVMKFLPETKGIVITEV